MNHQTLIQQLWGRQFALLTGAKDFVAGEDRLTMRIGRNPKRVSHVRITLDPSDTYRMEFLNVRAGECRTVAEVPGVYHDQLKDVFEAHTGLFVTLSPRH